MTRHRGRRDDDATQDAAGEAPGAIAAGMRIDRWLWCARFFKSRSLAQAAVEGGHVQLNGDRIKASRQVRCGDRLLVTRGQERLEFDVTGLPGRRGPATEARSHYRETPESEAARAQRREFQRLTGHVDPGRPDKRQRRDLLRLLRRPDPLSDDGDA